jgi:hypothetical protein
LKQTPTPTPTLTNSTSLSQETTTETTTPPSSNEESKPENNSLTNKMSLAQQFPHQFDLTSLRFGGWCDFCAGFILAIGKQVSTSLKILKHSIYFKHFLNFHFVSLSFKSKGILL